MDGSIINASCDDERKLDGLYDSPAKVLSVELIAEIFMNCLIPENDKFPSSTRPFHKPLWKPSAIPKTSEAPLLLGRICRFWRQVTYSTPELWTNPVFYAPNDHEKTDISQKTFKAIEKWLFYSKSLPISVVLSSEKSWGHEGNVTKILEMLIPHSKRWKSVRLISLKLTRSALEKICKEISDNSPLLETLNFSFVNPIPDGALDNRKNRRIPIDFSNSVKLKTLIMYTEVWECIDVVRPPAQLKFLEFSNRITRSDFFRLLRSFPFLDTLEARLQVDFEGENERNPNLGTNTILNHAKTLHLLIDAHLGVTALLNSLRLPFLENLTLLYASLPAASTFLPTQLLAQSGCNLKTLFIGAVLHKINFEEELLPFLQLAPSLEELEIKTKMDNMAIERLILNQGQESSGNICPNLQVIKLPISEPVPYALLGEMVKSRCENQQSCNSRVSIALYGYLPDLADFPDVLECLRRHKVRYLGPHL